MCIFIYTYIYWIQHDFCETLEQTGIDVSFAPHVKAINNAFLKLLGSHEAT